MKKGLINEAFRLQQLAGLAPISEVVSVDEPEPSYRANAYIRSTKEFGEWYDWGTEEDEDGNPTTGQVIIKGEKTPREFPLSDIEIWEDEEEEEPEYDPDMARDIKYDR